MNAGRAQRVFESLVNELSLLGTQGRLVLACVPFLCKDDLLSSYPTSETVDFLFRRVEMR